MIITTFHAIPIPMPTPSHLVTLRWGGSYMMEALTEKLVSEAREVPLFPHVPTQMSPPLKPRSLRAHVTALFTGPFFSQRWRFLFMICCPLVSGHPRD